MNRVIDTSPEDEAAALGASLLAAGVFAVAIGVTVLLWRDITVVALAWTIGAHLIVEAVTLTALGRYPMRRRRAAHGVVAATVALVGLAILMWAGTTVRILALLFGAGVSIGAVGMVGFSRFLRGRLSACLVAAGVLGVLAAITACFWREITVGTLAMLVGVYLVAHGISLSVAGWHVRTQVNWSRRRAQLRVAVHDLEVRRDRNGRLGTRLHDDTAPTEWSPRTVDHD